MPVIFEIMKFKVSINADDHAPPHAHVNFKDLEVVVDLRELAVMHKSKGIRGNDLKFIMAQLGLRRDELLAKWREYHD